MIPEEGKEPLFTTRGASKPCPKCDVGRGLSDCYLDLNRLGTPCDICAGTGYDYLGRRCRHEC